MSRTLWPPRRFAVSDIETLWWSFDNYRTNRWWLWSPRSIHIANFFNLFSQKSLTYFPIIFVFRISHLENDFIIVSIGFIGSPVGFYPTRSEIFPVIFVYENDFGTENCPLVFFVTSEKYSGIFTGFWFNFIYIYNFSEFRNVL